MAVHADLEPQERKSRADDMIGAQAPRLVQARRRLRVEILRELVRRGLYNVEVEALADRLIDRLGLGRGNG
jgi:anti-sigma28 factor (negative regulator of flagellin synthesis)